MNSEKSQILDEPMQPVNQGPLWRPAVVLLGIMTVLLGLAYPLAMTGLASVLFRDQASGSLIRRDGVVVGSAWIGQQTTDPGLFWPRPSAINYQAGTSGGSNLAMGNPALLSAVEQRAETLRFAGGLTSGTLVPVDLVTASASGLDPHISPAAAEFQAPRVARVRGMELARVRQLIRDNTEPRSLGMIGEPRVHVLRLNLDLLAQSPKTPAL